MDGRTEKESRKILLAYYTESRELEIIEANPHDKIDKYLISDKSIRLDISQAKDLYSLLKDVFN